MTEQISPEIQQKIMEFQEAQQQARMVMTQKYQIEIQLREVQNALGELEKLEKAEVHKAVGQILIKTDKASMTKELKDKEETLGVRLKTIEKQEDKLKEKMQGLQDRLQGVIGPAPSAGG
ncbi:MAG: prefoldin subunit beta [archaeon]